MTNMLLNFNRLYLILGLALGLLLIGYQITVIGQNRFFYLIGAGYLFVLFESILFVNFVYPNHTNAISSLSILCFCGFTSTFIFTTA
jgi:hypothetical protein